MGEIVRFFKMVWNGLVQMFNWLRSIPAILLASVVGFCTAVSTLVNSLSANSSSVLAEAIQTAGQPVSMFYSILQSMPDIVKLGFYCVSMDILYRFVLAAFMLFVGGICLVFEFQLITFATFIASVYVYKLVAWVINAFFPNTFSISGIKSIASADVPQIGSEIIDV